MLILKLLIVPLLLAAISYAARIWGPRLGGLLAGLPVVAGPILAFMAFEQGPAFAATAAQGTLLAVVACIAYAVAFAQASRRLPWWAALACGWSSWLIVALLLSWLPNQLALTAGLTWIALWLAPAWLPPVPAAPAPAPRFSMGELLARMAAGAALVLTVTGVAALVGTRWAGLLAMFPVLGTVLSVFSLRASGPIHVVLLFRGMFRGFHSFAVFCVLLAWLLDRRSPALAFGVAVLAVLAVQLAWQWLQARQARRPQTAMADVVPAD